MVAKKSVKKNNKARRQLFGGNASKLKPIKFGESRAYLFEYGLLLLVVGGLLGVLTSMLSSVIQILGSNSTINQSADAFALEQSVMTLSVGLVLLPLLLILSKRTALSETVNPFIKNSNWRKAFLGIFLATLTITAIVVAISHVNELLNYIVQGEEGLDWRTQLGSGLTVLILALTVGVVANDYRYTLVNRYPGMLQRYFTALLVATLLIGLFFVAGPLLEQRRSVEQDRKHHHSFGERCNHHFGPDEDDNFMPRPLLESY